MRSSRKNPWLFPEYITPGLPAIVDLIYGGGTQIKCDRTRALNFGNGKNDKMGRLCLGDMTVANSRFPDDSQHGLTTSVFWR